MLRPSLSLSALLLLSVLVGPGGTALSGPSSIDEAVEHTFMCQACRYAASHWADGGDGRIAPSRIPSAAEEAVGAYLERLSAGRDELMRRKANGGPEWVVYAWQLCGLQGDICAPRTAVKEAAGHRWTERGLARTYPEVPLNMTLTSVTTPRASRPVPRIVHFVFGLTPSFGDRPYGLVQYLAVKSAHDVLRPERILLHYRYAPARPQEGEGNESLWDAWTWWERTLPMVTLTPIEDHQTVVTMPGHGVVEHFAHRGDFIRLSVLHKYGGVYLDMDMITIRPFYPFVENGPGEAPDFVMAKEDGTGLCNAVIISSPQAPFLEVLMTEAFATFTSEHWNLHSVILPEILAAYYPDAIRVLGPRRFFWPLWDEDGLRTLYQEPLGGKVPYRFDDGNFGVHLWNSLAYSRYLKGLTIHRVFEFPTAFHCLARRFLVEDHPAQARAQQPARPPSITSFVPSGSADGSAVCPTIVGSRDGEQVPWEAESLSTLRTIHADSLDAVCIAGTSKGTLSPRAAESVHSVVRAWGVAYVVASATGARSTMRVLREAGFGGVAVVSKSGNVVVLEGFSGKVGCSGAHTLKRAAPRSPH